MSLYKVAGAFVVIWLIEYFGYNAGDSVHILLVIAIILILANALLLPPSATRVKGLEKQTGLEK